MNAGEVSAVIFYNSNPSYTYPDAGAFDAALAKVDLKISFADRDETAAKCDYILPDSHYLESCNDAEPVKAAFSLQQPAIKNLFDTKQAQEVMLSWIDAPVTDYHEYIKANWKANVAWGATEQDWFKILQDGVYNYAGEDAAAMAFAGNVNDAAAKIAARKQGGDEVVVYGKTGLGNGNQANNPWLQELPDPISKVCWDNYFAVSPKFAKDKGWKQVDVIEVKAGSASVKAPVCLQPGQADNTLAIAMCYGRTAAGTAANGVEAKAFAFLSMMVRLLLLHGHCHGFQLHP